ncbi:MAG: polyisoprenoid-binding protein [Streptosporangiales bacterium]|nr:polyisoprenoid-binding protein [Streptosporangiales bacterium]
MTTATDLGLVPGTYTIDPAHSEIGFTVRHMMVSKVRGRFGTFEGTLNIAENPLDSTVTAEIDMSSINTGQEQRDEHIRSNDFFSVAEHPKMTFRSTGIRPDGDGFLLDGELTIKGDTRPVTLELEFEGSTKDPMGFTRVGFSAEGEISRSEFGVDIQMPMDGGGVVVGDKIKLDLAVEATLNQE